MVTAVLARERLVPRNGGGDPTDAEVTACLRVLGEMLRLPDDVDVG